MKASLLIIGVMAGITIGLDQIRRWQDRRAARGPDFLKRWRIFMRRPVWIRGEERLPRLRPRWEAVEPPASDRLRRFHQRSADDRQRSSLK